MRSDDVRILAAPEQLRGGSRITTPQFAKIAKDDLEVPWLL